LKKITKAIEQKELTAYRSSILIEDIEKPNIYEDYSDDGVLRKQLLEEQGYVCCYCMGRISERNSKIEHFQAQSKFRNRQIDYSNLFVACKGGEGSREQYCDTAKGNMPLTHIDLLRAIENEIKYLKNGRVQSKITTVATVSDLTKELNNILKLNTDILIHNRKQTYNEFIKKLQNKWTKSNLQKAIDSYKSKQGGKYAPYSEMMICLLSKKVRSM
jgi:uncharacterized protein (TIGR02646 family)